MAAQTVPGHSKARVDRAAPGISTVGDSPGRRGASGGSGSTVGAVGSSRGGNSPFDARRNLRCRSRGHPDRSVEDEAKTPSRPAQHPSSPGEEGKRGRQEPARHLAVRTRFPHSFHNLDIEVPRAGEVLRLGGEGTAGGLARPAGPAPSLIDR